MRALLSSDLSEASCFESDSDSDDDDGDAFPKQSVRHSVLKRALDVRAHSCTRELACG